MVGKSLGHYHIVEQLGAGGMGEVYRATDTSLKRQVAIKVLPDALAADGEGLARFQREAEVLASLNHPNIAAIYGLERSGGQLALVMELVEGPTLADRIAQGALSLDDALLIAQQIAEALEAAHDKGIVHRDLKPANVKVRTDGTVKLLDFGLAKLGATGDTGATGAVLSSDAVQPTITSPALMTRAGLILGTAAYMSPEQARGRPADARSDIWSFGVVLVEMVTGRRPFEGETISDIIAAILTREPELDGVPPALRRLVASCLAKSPRDRLRHIGDAMTLVDRSPAASPVERRRQVPGWASGAGLFAVVAFMLIVAWLMLRPRATSDAVTRFYIDAPPGSAFNYTYSATAVSPDARHIVFRVATTTEGPALWLRPLDSLDGRRLPGTEGADFPFWSPDGRSIAFFAAGKLKRVDVSGSSPIVLCDASDADSAATEGSWNRDGVIIFGSPNGLYRVNASGGVPTLFSPVVAAAGETGYGSPQFLPDGDRFIVFVRTQDASRRGYYVSSLSNPNQKNLLLPSGTKAVFVADEGSDTSYLLYLQDRTLLARRIDRRTLALSGDPVPMASNVALFPPGFQASFWASASSRLLVYRSEASDKPRLTWIHPDGKQQSEAGADDFYTNVRVSPDGGRAIVELGESGNRDVWMWDFARRAKSRLTFDPRADRAPTWAPNGREIAFSSNRSGEWQLFRKDVSSGQPEEPLTTGPADKILPDWSRDGRFIVFIQIGETTTEDIWAMPLEGDRQPFPILQSTAIETNPALSPDGRWLAFESSQSGRPEVYVTRFPDARRVVDAAAARWQVSTLGGSRPRWSGDGRMLYFAALDSLSIMRTAVRTSKVGFEYEAPRVHAEIPVMMEVRSPYDATADGRLLVLERTINQTAPLAIVSNWTAMLQPR